MPTPLETKQRVLKGYLREFYGSCDKSIRTSISKIDISPNKRTYFVYGPEHTFKPFLQYYLLKDGRKDWQVMNVYELVDIFLGNHAEYTSILDINVPYLILTLGQSEMENKRQFDFINQLLHSRVMSGKKTLIFGFGHQSYNTFSSKFTASLKQKVDIVNLYQFNKVSFSSNSEGV